MNGTKMHRKRSVILSLLFGVSSGLTRSRFYAAQEVLQRHYFIFGFR